MKKKCIAFLFVTVLGFIITPSNSFAQTPGFIFEPSLGSGSIFDPNGDGFVSQSSLGFSNDGYDVDEFEIPMFPIPTLGDGEPISDLSSGPTCGFTDMSFDTNGEATYAGIDALNNLLFRYRLSSAAPNAKGYTILIDTDGLVGALDPNSTNENPGFEIAITLITKHGVYIYDVDGMDDCSIEKKVYVDNSNYQKAATITGPCGDQDVFYDFYVPFSDLTTYFGITTSTPIRFISTTNTSASCAFQGSLSDIGGVDDEVYGGCSACAFEDLVNSYPPVPVDSLCNTCSGFLPSYSDCPIINQPVTVGVTSINGTAEPNAIVHYKIYDQNGTLLLQDSTIADGLGGWISNAISPAINSNDSIVVGALTPGKTVINNCTFVIAGATCTASPLDNGTITASNKGFCGSAGNALNGAEIRIYKNGVLQNPGSGTPAPIIVAADGSWIWKCNANSGCNGGTSCLTDGVYMITQQISGECESQPTVVCFNTTGATSTPTINVPLSTIDSNITGTAVIASTIYLYVNGELETTGIADGAGNWSITGVTLNKCDTVMARASIGSLCISAYSSPIVVSESSVDPVLNCGYFYGDVNINGTAVGDANDPVYITVYDVSSGTPIADTTYLTAFNNWTHTLSQPLGIGDSIKVKILPTCGELSNYSNVCIIPDTIQKPFLDCSLNYSSGDTIISGTHPTNGVNIHVFIDGDTLGTTTVISGSWSLIDSTNSLYTGAVLSSQANDGVSVSNLSNTCVVNCKLPDNSFTLSYPGDDIIQGNTTVAYLSGSETGVFYELFDVENNVPVGTTTFGTNSPLALGTFSLVDTTIIIVRAFKLPPVCEVFINDTILINVYLPVVNAMTDTVIVNSYDTIIIPAINNDVFIHTSPNYSSLNILTGFGPFNGSAVVDTLSGEIKYQANNGFTGSDSLLYAICDTNGFCDTAMLAINVTIVNSFPLASNDTILLNEDVAILIDVQSNDSDVDGDTLTTALLSGPSNGAALVVNGDSITYTPNPNFYGTDTIVYIISDGNGGTDTATVVITVDPVNDPPIAVDDNITTNEDTPVTVNVQANDSDIDGDTLITTILSGPSNGGAAVVNGDSITYTPNPNFNGTDTIVYVISDGNGGTDTATVVITVDPVNDPPVAVDDSVTENEDAAVTVDVQANDSDLDGDTLTTTILSGPSNGGAVVINGDSITYTPNPNFNGTDTIVYVISDGNGGTDTATVVITVDPVNDPPVAVDDSVTTNEDAAVTVDVQANDSDLDGDTLTTTILSGPSNGGAVVINGDSITYTPNPNFNGTDTIIYVISDGNGGSDTATVVITVDSVNDLPVVVNDSTTTNEDTPITVDVQSNDSDVDGDTLTTALLSGPSNGAALVVNGDSITYTPNPNFYGTDTIVYIISDGNGGTDTATVVITVDPVNDSPVAVDDSTTSNEDTPVTIDVQANDSDLDGDTLTTTILSGPSNGGAVVINGDSITYTPNPNFNGTDTIVYVISDGNGGTDTAQVIITVNPVNDAPVAVDDSSTTNEDNLVTLDVQANDSDLDGDTLTTTILSGPSNGGTVVINGDSITYTPNPNFNGTDTIVYVISDGNGGTDTATVVITVDPVNDSPVAVDDSATSNEDTPITVDVQANDSDLDGDALTTTFLSGPSNGGAVVVNGDSITYTPNPNFNGTDTIVYVISDGNGGSDTATVVIAVDPVNDPPVAVDDSATSNEDTPVTVDVQANDSDLDGDTLTTTILSGPSNGGAVVINGDSITYTPNPNFNGTDTIVYVISDGNGGTDTATVVITVDPVNDPSVAVDDSTTSNEDTPVTVDVQANDSDLDGDTLTTTILSGPSNGGAVVINGDSITYTPNPNFNGTDTIVYVISDGNGGTDTATVVITVDPVNDSPVAVDDSATSNEDTPVTVNVQANDSDLDGDTLTTTILSGPSNGGAVVINGDSITYTPNPNFNRTDTIVYVISDGNGGTDTATVVITVDPVNDSPVAVDDSVTTNEDAAVTVDVQANDSDLDGDTLTTTILSGPSNGGAVVVNGDSITYTPNPNFNGTDTIVYVISDGNGGTDTATVVITVDPVNDSPVAVDDSATSNEDTPITVDVQANDSDLDGDALTTTFLSGPSNGGAVVVNGDSILYTPNPNFNGTDTIVYVISDGNGGSDTATVVIAVDPVNDPPVAVDDSATSNEDTPVTVDVQANDSDLDGDTLTTTILSGPSNGGAVVINGDSITYTPNPNFNGTDTIVYVISDGNGGTDTATVVITVDPVNDPSVAVDDSVSTNEDAAVTVDVQTNDSDLDGDTLTTTILSGPSNGGAVVINGDSITYTPNPNFNGTDTIVYVISDGNGGTDTAFVVIMVNPINDVPVAMNDTSTTNEDTPVTVDVQANDSDLDGDALTTTILIAPTNGTASLLNGDSISYTPSANFNGNDTLTYVISDGNGGTDTAIVVITVDPVNDAPVAVDDSTTTNEDTPLTLNVQANDSDLDGDALTTTILHAPANGTASLLNGDSISYTPNANFNGNDTLTYIISDGNGGTDTAIVVITVNPTNDAPVAVDDSTTTNEDTPIVVEIQLNDYDVEGDSITTTIIAVGPNNGTAVILNGDSISYMPNPNFNGIDTLVYFIEDGNGLTGSATVVINVLPVNDTPVASNDVATTPEDSFIVIDIQVNDIDVDGDILITTVLSGPSNGTISIINNDSILYTPNPSYYGFDTLSYIVCDPLGACDTAEVIIDIGGVNDPPVAVNDSASTNEDTPVTVDVQANDSDLDGDAFTTMLLSGPNNGVAIVVTGDSIEYVPNSNFNGIDSLSYSICDVFGLCDTATVIINVISINDAPVAVVDSAITNENTTVVFTILTNDIDVDNNIDTSSVNIIIGPFNGTAVFNSITGLVMYNPNSGFRGVDSLYYLLCDQGFPVYCDTGLVIIQVSDTNYAPLAIDDASIAQEDTPLMGFTVLSNDIDLDGDSLSVLVTPVFGTVNGTLVLNATGTYLYTPNINFYGVDSFAYVVCDNGIPLLCDTALVIIDVTSSNDSPVAVDDSVSTNQNTSVLINVPLNDYDVDSNINISTIMALNNPLNGVLNVNPISGQILYTPNYGYSGVDSFEYIVCDFGIPVICDTAIVTVTVIDLNDSLIAVDDNVTVSEDSMVTFNTLINDSDPDNNLDSATVTVSSGPSNGIAVVDTVTGNITYTPNPDFNGLDSLVYGVCDTGSPIYCGSATVYITVSPFNDALVAVDDVVNTTEDNPITANLVTNDLDIDGNIDTSSINLISLPLNGTAYVDPLTGELTYTPNPNFNGVDSVLYVICDTGIPVYCDTATVIINVSPVNNDPVAVDDFASADPGVSVVIDVQVNDIDPDSDSLTTTIISGPSNGIASVVNGDSITYSANVTFLSGIDTIVYVICDNDVPQGCDTAYVYVIVPKTNLPPIAIDDNLTVLEDSTATIDVSVNDFNSNGDSLGFLIIGGPTYGSAINNGNGLITYSPNPNYNGQDTITYLVCDSVPNCDTAVVIVHVVPVNDNPVAVIDSALTLENVSVIIFTASNDSDTDNNLDVTKVTISVNPINGTVTVNPITGDITYIPNLNFNGLDSLMYSICDFGFPIYCDTAWQYINVLPVNSAVLAVDDSITIPMNTPVYIPVLTNDIDPELDLDTASLFILSGPLNGVAFVDPITNTIVYNASNGFNGYDSLTYIICDNGLPVFCDTAVVNILVGFVNLPPIASMDTASTHQNIPVSTNLITNDFDPNGNINTNSIIFISGPLNGIAAVNPNDGVASYLPAFGYYGMDTITYVICDDGLPVFCDTSIWVISVINENDPPIANNDAAIASPSTSIVIDVQFNDSDPDGNPLSTIILQNPNYGIAVVLNGDSVAYTPFVGVNSVVDTFIYIICDNATPGLCDTAIVSINIPIINIPPVASNEQVNILEDSTVVISVLANDYDPNGDSLTLTITGGPSNGTATLNPDGTVTYTPNLNYNGLDTLFYHICDAFLICDSAFTVINIIPTNDPPVAVNDTASALSGVPVVIAVLGNDFDFEGNINYNSVTVISGPFNGTVTIDPITGEATYIPSLTFGGTDVFTYVICDLGLPVYCDTAAVSIDVTLSNVPPVVVNDSVITNEEIPVNFQILTNDSDPDSNINTSSIAIVSGPFNGTAMVDSSTGEINYIPNLNFNGIDSLVYQLCDTGMPIYCDSATVYITVNPINDPPIAGNDSVAVLEDTPVTLSVANNDIDPDNNIDTLSVSVLTGPSSGTISVDPLTGDITYTPNANYNGNDTIVYQICDTGIPIYCDSATVIISIIPVNDSPIAFDDNVSTNEGTPVTFDPLINDIDVEGGLDPGSVGIISGPNNGTVSVDAITGQITYTPGSFFNGLDTIVYTVCDSGMPVLCDTATVIINVGSVNNPPVAVDDSDVTNEDTPITIVVLSNDTDIDGNIDPTSIGVIGGPNNGMAIIDPVTGDITYIPNMNFFGVDTFTYVVCDQGSPVYCDTAIVIITILPVNDPPVALNDTIVTQQGNSQSISVDINDFDIDGSIDPTTVVVLSGPIGGTATVDPLTGIITYIPNPNFFGIDSIVYLICDNGSPVLCDTATLYINVLKGDEPNVFVPNAFSPNGDLIYDLWVIDGIENYPNNVLKIYNRWGNVVYEKKGYDNSWNGTSNAGLLVIGKDLPDGTYYYVLDLGEGGKANAGFVVIKRK